MPDPLLHLRPQNETLGRTSTLQLPPRLESPVIATCVNHGYVASGLLENWVYSLARLGLERHILIAALDDDAAALTSRLPGTTLRWNAPELPVPATAALRYRREGWKPVVFSKLSFVRSLLEDGFRVLLSDADVVFLKDPRPWFPDEDRAEFAVQSNATADATGDQPDAVCAGLYFVLPTRSAIATFHFGQSDVAAAAGEQDFFRRRLTVDRSARFEMLPRHLFPNGHLWQHRPPDDPVAVHANWVVGVDEKVALLQRTGLWLAGPARE